MSRQHLILVGLPGAGKSAVGWGLARVLAAPFVDIDALIEEEAGTSVSQVFAEHGESVFRDLERLAVERALAGEPAVLAPGGGWAAQQSNLASVVGTAFTIYLETDVEAAAARTLADGPTRPLLTGPNRALELADLLRKRERFYSRCDAAVRTQGRTVQEVVREVAALARGEAGW